MSDQVLQRMELEFQEQQLELLTKLNELLAKILLLAPVLEEDEEEQQDHE